MPDWISLERARRLPGLRLVLLRGLPSPWSLAARALFELEGVPFAKVYRAESDPPGLLREWTGQEGFPAAMLDEERPRTGWAEILLLAERLAPEPRLLPPDPRDRALLFGLAHELLGELGLVWCRRLLGLAPRLAEIGVDPEVARFAHRYGSSLREAAGARARVIEILGLFAGQLRRQREAGRGYLIGTALSALDVYWAAASNVIALLPDAKLPLAPEVRRGFATTDPELLGALDPLLLAHRERVVERHLGPPIEV